MCYKLITNLDLDITNILVFSPQIRYIEVFDHFGSWGIKGTGESTLVTDSPVPLMHHDPDRSSITDPNSDHLKGTHSPVPISLS